MHPDDRRRSRGVYTLANDGVYDWLAAFLASYHDHEPNLPVIVIPFDDRMDRVRTLRERFRFEIFEGDCLRELDRIGATYFPDNYNWTHVFRKFAAFWGPFERFVFLDSDIVLLGPLGEFFDRAEEEHQVEYVCGDLDIDQVYTEGPLRDQMAADGQTTGFNTGFFLSSRNAFTVAEAEPVLLKVRNSCRILS